MEKYWWEDRQKLSSPKTERPSSQLLQGAGSDWDQPQCDWSPFFRDTAVCMAP